MEPMIVIVWALCLGVAWIVFAGMTGADEWLKSLLGTSKAKELEERVSKPESRLEEMERQQET